MKEQKRKLGKVSIIIPVYNASKYLEQTLKSVINQTYRNWEALAVDDCSSDKSYKILKKYSEMDSRIIVLKNKSNLGAYAARNFGILESCGEYIAFLDSDDLWVEKKLEEQIKFMNKEKCNFTYTGFSRFFNKLKGNEKKIKIPKKIDYKSLMIDSVIVTSSVMVNIKNIGFFQMQNAYYDDFILWLNLLKREKFAFGINKPLLNYRITNDSLSRNKLNSAIKVYEIFHKNLDLNFFEAKYKFFLWAINSNLKYLFKY